MGVRGHAPRIVFIKHGAIWCILYIPKHVIINLKINNVKDNKLKLLTIFFSNIKTKVFADIVKKISTNFAFYKWGLGRQ